MFLRHYHNTASPTFKSEPAAPPMSTSGVSAIWQFLTAVMVLVRPGPAVTAATPGTPDRRATASAANTAVTCRENRRQKEQEGRVERKKVSSRCHDRSRRTTDRKTKKKKQRRQKQRGKKNVRRPLWKARSATTTVPRASKLVSHLNEKSISHLDSGAQGHGGRQIVALTL